MKKLTLRVLCIGWILFLSAGSFIFTDESCHGNSLTTFIFQIGNTEVLVNQTIWRMDVAPELTDHRTFIPLRFLAEKMGAVVSWKENPSQIGEGAISIQFTHPSGYQKKIVLHTNYHTVFVETTLNAQSEPTIQTITLDAAPYIKIPNNRTLVPLRFISETVGAKVSWEESTQSITVEWEGFYPPEEKVLLDSSLLPQPKIEWSLQMPSQAIQRGEYIQSTIDGGYILCGSQEDTKNQSIYIVKLKSDGSPEWEKNLSEEEGFSYGVYISQTADNGYLVVGNHINPLKINLCDIVLYRLNNQGDLLWEKIIGGERDDTVLSVELTRDRGYLLTGYSDSFSEPYQQEDILLIKIDESGNVILQKTYGNKGAGWGTDCFETEEGELLVCGSTENQQGKQEILLMKTDLNGNLSWEQTYGKAGNYFINAMLESNDNGFVLVGETDNYSETQGIYLFKTDRFGKKLWEKYYEKTESTIGYSIAKTNSGGYMIAGSTNVTIDDLLSESGNADGYLLFTDAYGNKIWDQVLEGDQHDSLYCITRSLDLGFIACGNSSSNPSGKISIWLVKIYPIIEDEALLDVNPEMISFGLIEKNSAKVTAYLTISNLGSQNLKGYLEFSQPWLLLYDQSFIIPGFSSLKVLVSLLPSKLEEGLAEDYLNITSNGGKKRIRVFCTVVDNSPKLWVYPTEYDFGTIQMRDKAKHTLTIANYGRKNLMGTIQSTVAWLQVTPATFNQNDLEVTIQLRPSILKNGDFTGFVEIASNGGKQSVKVTVKCAFPLLKIEFCVGKPTVTMNGQKTTFDKDNQEIVPFIMEGRTLVPFRFIGEAFGATLEWDNLVKQIRLSLPSKEIKMVLTVNQKTALVNQEKIRLDVPPLIFQGRVFVPIRFVAETFGANVNAVRDEEGNICVTILYEK